MKTTRLLPVCLLILSIALSYSDVILHYDGEENSGDLVDRVNGRHAAPVNTGHTYQMTGPTGFGKSVSLSANGSWQLSVTDSAILRNLSNNFSITAWIYVDSALFAAKTGTNAAHSRIIGDDVAWDADGWSLGVLNTGRVRFTKNGIVDAELGNSGAVPFNQWAHVAATVSSTGGTKLFVNGISVGTHANTTNLATGLGNNGLEDAYAIGRSYGIGEGQWFAGHLDEVQVHNTVLTEAQIQALMVPPRDPALITNIQFSATGDAVPQTLSIPFTNEGNSQDLIISAITFSGADAGTFSVPTLPGTLAAGGNGVLEVSFTPDTGYAVYTATMTVASNDPEKPNFDVAVTMTAVDPNIDPHLVSHFSFDDPGQLGNDTGTFDNDGTANGNAQFSSNARLGGGALALDGNGDYINVGGAADYSALAGDGDGFTMTVWIRPNSLSGVRRIFSVGKLSGFSGNGWGAGVSGAAPFATTYGRFDFSSGVDSFSTGVWSHAAYVYRPASGQILFYVDGSLITTITGTAGILSTTDSFIIGGIGIPANGQWFDGSVDDLRIYDNELDAAAISTLANPVVGPTIHYLFANPAPLTSTGASTLTWSVANADSLVLDGGPFVNQIVTGLTNISTDTLTNSTTFTLTATGQGLQTSQQITVAMTDAALDPVINEFLAANTSTLTDEDGKFSDWIEIYNPNTFAYSLAGWHLTDNASSPGEWEFPAISLPANGYLLVFASEKNRATPGAELHSNFKLSASGEYLALTRPDLSIAQKYAPAFPIQIDDYSYGGTSYFVPTPGTANGSPLVDLPPLVTALTGNPTAPDENTDLPIAASVQSTGAAIASVTLTYSIGYNAETSIAMTAGAGSEYTASIPATAYASGDMVRWFVTATSAGGSNSRFPIFKDPIESPEYHGTVVTDSSINTPLPVLHWFVQNPAASETRSGTQASLFFDGKFYDNVYCRIRGQSAGSWPKHKFKFDFYKGGHFKWDANQPKVEEFNLQSHYREVFGQSANSSYMRESLMFWWMKEAGAAVPDSFHLHLRRNGSFYGLYSFVEQIDEDFLTKHGYSATGPMYKAAAQSGSATLSPNPVSGQYRKVLKQEEPFADLTAFCANINVSNPNRFQYVWDNVDLAQWINVIAAMNVPFNHDQLTKNYYVYREPESGEWHRFPWDADQSFPVGQYITGQNWTSPLYGDTEHTQELNGGSPNPAWQNHMHDAIMDNPVTREMYMRRVKSLTDQYLNSSYFEDLIEATRLKISADAAADRTAWAAKGVTISDINNGISEILNIALPARRTHLLTTYASLLPATQPASPSVTFGTIVYNPSSGNQDEEYIEIQNQESVAIDISKWTLEDGVTHTFQPGTIIPSNSTLYLSPNILAFRARATSPKGGESRFAQGNYAGHLSNLGETLTLRDVSGTLVATATTPYDPSDAQRYLVVSEIMYHPVNPDDEFIELLNVSDTVTLDLTGVVFTAGINYAFPAATMMTPGQRIVIHFADFLNLSRLNNNGDQIKLEDASGSTIREFRFDDEFPWPASADGTGASLVLIAPEAVPDHNIATNWRPSTTFGGNPGTSDSIPLIGENLIDYALSSPPVITANREFQYTLNIGADGVSIEVQTSTNLITWTPSEIGTATGLHSGSGTLTWTIPLSGDIKFARLKLSR